MNKKKSIFLLCLIIFLILFFFLIIFKFSNDGTETIKYPKIKVRIFDGNNWSYWSKNGTIKGKINDNKYIKNIEIKSNDLEEIALEFYSYEKNDWIDDIDFKSQDMSAIRINVYKKLSTNYMICYRTYNDTNKWMGWSCNNEINGNKSKKIKAVQIELIPKRGLKSDYLKNYSDSKVKNVNFD